MILRRNDSVSRITGILLASLLVGCGAKGTANPIAIGNAGGTASGTTGGSAAASGGDTSQNSNPTGGANNSAGGSISTGGAATGGTKATGGAATGGTKATGGAATGGTKATGGAATGGASVAAVDCTDVANNSGTLSSQYQHAAVSLTGNTKSYIITSNWWDQFSGQTVAYNGNSYTIGGTASNSGSNNPSGFPSIFIGNYGNNGNSTGSNLPKKVTDLTTIPTLLDSNASSTSGQFNVTYDVWFNPNGTVDSSAGNPGSGGYFLMVWLFQPTGAQPRGQEVSAQASPIAGVTGNWRIWTDGQNGAQPPCVSYVAASNIDTLSFDLNAFIKDARQRGYISDQQQLALIFGGSEIWSGGTGLQIKRFCAIVN